MKKNIIFFTILILIVNQSCKKKLDVQKKKKESIVIIFEERTFEKDTLKINNNANYNITPSISYTKENESLEKVILPTNFLKNDTIIIKTKKNIILTHRYHFYYNSIYFFRPGDTVYFKYIDDAPFCKIKNEKNQTQNFETKFNLANKVFKNNMEFFLKNNRFRNDTEQTNYENLIKEYLSKKSNLVKFKKSDNSLNEEYFYYAKNKILYEEFSFLNNNSMKIKQPFFSNDSLLVLPIYKTFINSHFIKTFNILPIKNKNHWKINNKSIFDSLNRKSPKNKSDEYLLFYHLNEIAENFSTSDFKIYYNKFRKEVKDSILLKEIKNRYLPSIDILKEKTKTIYLLDLNKSRFTLQDIKNQNKGKLIYIDYWASWCAPCIKAMPSSKELQQDYKNKDIVFVYISIDKNFKKWGQAAKKEEISLNKFNFLASNYPEADFYKELKLKSIPRYLLFNKKGRLVHKNAPSPESKELRKLLNNYLKE